jgi:uncharacterized protein
MEEIMNITEELERLEKLRQAESISEEEFQKAKNLLLQKQAEPKTTELSINNWCMLIHLSQFSGYLFPLAGFIVPVILWQMKIKDSALIDIHGKIVVNWIISSLIYYTAGAILSIVLIGIPILIGIAILSFVFPIIGGIKANQNEVWKYPLSISFFKVEPYSKL